MRRSGKNIRPYIRMVHEQENHHYQEGRKYPHERHIREDQEDPHEQESHHVGNMLQTKQEIDIPNTTKTFIKASNNSRNLLRMNPSTTTRNIRTNP